MCTLIVATRVWQRTPLVVAANRDERLGRASRGPALVVQGGVRFYAPRDLQAGGTWIGLNDHGVFVGITNRFTGMAPTRVGRSRGLLVLDALSEDSAAHAVRRIASDAPSRHDPFHLVMADAAEAHLVWSDGARVYHETLAPGFHVVTERSLGAATSARVDRLQRELPALFGPQRPTPERWMAVLREHDPAGFEGTCVHVPAHGYGTRSATVLELGRAPTDTRWWHADGPPCTSPFAEQTEALRPLFG
jgi:uncharacterized protein with NRDE domain